MNPKWSRAPEIDALARHSHFLYLLMPERLDRISIAPLVFGTAVAAGLDSISIGESWLRSAPTTDLASRDAVAPPGVCAATESHPNPVYGLGESW